MSPLSNAAFSSEKVIWSESGEKSAQIKPHLQAKTALNKYVCGFWCERTTVDEPFHWKKRFYGLWTGIYKVKNVLMMGLFILNM